MPAKAQWLLEIPSILVQLRALEVPVVDRSTCERMFGVRRRRAVQLMQGFGGYRSGNAVLLDRMDLIRQLEALASSPSVERECRRKERLDRKLGDLHRYRAAAAVRIEVLPVTDQALPAGVRLGAGQMTVSFAKVEDLLSTLYALAQSAAADFERFRAVAEDGSSPATEKAPS
jgi:hypothetical protein